MLLNELYKCTPETHVDRVDIGHSVERMIQVNRCINEKQKAIAASEEELAKCVTLLSFLFDYFLIVMFSHSFILFDRLEGLEELLEDPKAWHTANNFIKHEGKKGNGDKQNRKGL